VYVIVQDEQKILNQSNILKIRFEKKTFHIKVVEFHQMAIPI